MNARPAVIVQYLTALDEGDFAVALDCFAEEATYAVPPTPDHGGGRTVLLRGRPEIGAHFARRGRRDYRHDVRAVGLAHDRWWATGTVRLNDDEVDLFASLASLNADGLIEKYFTVSTTLRMSEAEELLC